MLLAADPDLAARLTQAKATAEADQLRGQIQELTAQLDKTRRRLKAEKGHTKRLRRKLDAIDNHKEDTMTDNQTNDNDNEKDAAETQATEAAAPAGQSAPAIAASFAPYRDHAPETDIAADKWMNLTQGATTIIMHDSAPAGEWSGWVSFTAGEGFTVGIDNGNGRVADTRDDIAHYANYGADHNWTETAWLDDMTALAGYFGSTNAKTADDLSEDDATQARESYDHEFDDKPEPGEVYERKMAEQEARARELRGNAANGKLIGDPVRRETLDLLRDIAKHTGRIADALESEANA